jgi:UDP-2,3-diacylglucosamine pyrophosphatase LpxH
MLIDFPGSCTDSDTIYLVGDIIDGWRAQEEILLARGA